MQCLPLAIDRRQMTNFSVFRGKLGSLFAGYECFALKKNTGGQLLLIQIS